MRGSRLGRGSGPHHLDNHKAIGFLGNTIPDPLENHKLPSQHSMFGHHRPVSETPFKWHFAGGPMMVRFLWYLDPLSSHQLNKCCQSLTKIAGILK